LLTKDAIATILPEFSSWKTLVGSASGEVLGKPLDSWQHEVRQELDLPTDKPIVIIGHQPTFFHPGILAKFIAADRLVQEIDGVLVYLVVDHHNGEVGVLQTPEQDIEIASVDSTVALNDQPRADVVNNVEPFTSALQSATGKTAATQFAHAIVQLLSPWATVHHVITASDLMQSEFAKTTTVEMYSDEQRCVDLYNDAVSRYPEGQIPALHSGELPIWKNGTREPRPRALFLTLLARLTACDLFVHGTGGMKYDRAMEYWCSTWLGVSPCEAVLATATLHLQLEYETIANARRTFHSPPFDLQTKENYLDAINDAPYKSPQRLLHFQKMHRWLHAIQEPLDFAALKREEEKAQRRDWAFPLYSTSQLQELYEVIRSM